MNNPFRYRPSQKMVAAAQELMEAVRLSPMYDRAFRDGKMLGVLLCRRVPLYGQRIEELGSQHIEELPDSQPASGQNGEKDIWKNGGQNTGKNVEDIILYAYSGKRLPDETPLTSGPHTSASHTFESHTSRPHTYESLTFVPPIYDITKGHFREKENEITSLNNRIAQLENEEEGHEARRQDILREIDKLKAQRAEESIALQRWTFKQYKVLNALGEPKDIETIFASAGLTPPAATGDCAAPKLLQYAYSHHLEPVEIGEFWYGKPPEGPVREQGRFYPACSWKCGPLLKYMMTGLHIEEVPATDEPVKTAETAIVPAKGTMTETETEAAAKVAEKPAIVYEDEHIAVAVKPSSMPSVPGLDGRKSLMEVIQGLHPERTVFEVHRLDQDTSGLIVYAFSRKDQAALRRQFENREVRKKYIAVLDGIPDRSESDDSRNESDFSRDERGDNRSESGIISLPLAPDYEDKPRQKVSYAQGKEAVTEYRIIENFILPPELGIFPQNRLCHTDGYTAVEFTPHTGRTHQLRVHAAHFRGLGCPIAGDTLYGSGSAATRLCLHASHLAFKHPESGLWFEFRSAPDFVQLTEV